LSWFDSHAHPELPTLAEELAAMAEADVEGFIAVGTNLDTSRQVLAVVDAAREAGVRCSATVGIHPHEAASVGASGVDLLSELIEERPDLISGVGECGLDYYYEYSDRRSQREVFVRQIELARERDLALVIHSRSAWEDTFEILGSTDLPSRVVMHCFVGSAVEAKRCLEAGFWISFSGIVTFKNAADVREAALAVPAERMLVETDSPYLAPVPLRGKRNIVANVKITGDYLAGLKGVPVQKLAEVTRENVRAVFGV
jgi:TatD DNase family protein